MWQGFVRKNKTTPSKIGWGDEKSNSRKMWGFGDITTNKDKDEDQFVSFEDITTNKDEDKDEEEDKYVTDKQYKKSIIDNSKVKVSRKTN